MKYSVLLRCAVFWFAGFFSGSFTLAGSFPRLSWNEKMVFAVTVINWSRLSSSRCRRRRRVARRFRFFFTTPTLSEKLLAKVSSLELRTRRVCNSHDFVIALKFHSGKFRVDCVIKICERRVKERRLHSIEIDNFNERFLLCYIF